MPVSSFATRSGRARPSRRHLLAAAVLACLAVGDASAADGEAARQLDRITVLGRRASLVGEAISASEGQVGQADLADRPILRTGDLLERVPGLVATQHSGSGKANQYFLRGFNLDHGTDFATFVDGMPVNMPTHGHGHGWTDLNFLIPETVESLTYRKGTYYADVGDFGSAGSARFALADRAAGRVAIEAGDDGYARAVLLDSAPAAGGDLLYAAELQAYDGPWDDVDEGVRKRSGMLRYSVDAGGGRAHATLMAYGNRWSSADQIPARAVAQGLITRLGSIDPTGGGDAARTSLSGGWDGPAWGGDLQVSAYAIRSRLDLWSNFTYGLDDPANGDQFQQVDDRSVYGLGLAQQWSTGPTRWRLGVDGRYDDIDRVALLRTTARRRVSTVRDDVVGQGSAAVHAAVEHRFGTRWRGYAGARHDAYRFRVDSADPENSGRASAGRTSYKASLAYRAAPGVELYASAGTGFHSNDARGTTIRRDPVTGAPAERVDALVGSRGAELGSRLSLGETLQATLAVWTLRLDSELLFVGDVGTTEPSRPSRREGIEAGMYWFPRESVSAGLEAAYSRSRFTDGDAVGARIPGSIPLVVSANVQARLPRGFSASAHLRHFGPYPLEESGGVRSDGATILNLRVGRSWTRTDVHLDVLNALDSKAHDIDYFYASRLAGEPAEGVEDVHYHAFVPRSVRVSVQYRF